MLTRALNPVSNLETWTDSVELKDADDGEALWDFDDDETWPSAITLKVRDPHTGCTELSGSLSGGELDIVGDGVFEFAFTATQMSALCAKTYEVGVLVTIDDVVTQIILGTLPVLKGL